MNLLIKNFFLLLLIFNSIAKGVTNLAFNSAKTKPNYKKTECLILTLKKDPVILKLAKALKYDLEFTDQMDVELRYSKIKPTTENEHELFEKGKAFGIYIDKKWNKTEISLKDFSTGDTHFNEKLNINKSNVIKNAHTISSKLLPLLTGEISMSQYGIAYSKMISNNQKDICFADYSCNIENKLISAPKTVNVAPSWHTKLPIIYFSQFDISKINLMSVNLRNKRMNTICSYEGLNMQPSFSKDGSKVALCMSGGENSEVYLYDTIASNKAGRKLFKKLTNNHGNNASPCLLETGDVIFCSDFQSTKPQIYYLDIKENNIYRLTNGREYSAAPSYCERDNSIIFSKPVNGTFQLFSLNLNDFKEKQPEEKQLTFNFGNKHEPDISPCGRFVLFSYDFEYKKGHQTQQVAVLNKNSGQIRVLTKTIPPKSFPRWSKKPIFT